MSNVNSIINALKKDEGSRINFNKKNLKDIILGIIEKTMYNSNKIILIKFIKFLLSSKLDINIIKDSIDSVILSYIQKNRLSELNQLFIEPLFKIDISMIDSNIRQKFNIILYHISVSIFNKYSEGMDMNIFIDRTLQYSNTIKTIRLFKFINMEQNMNEKIILQIINFLTYYFYKVKLDEQKKFNQSINEIKELILSYKSSAQSDQFKPYSLIICYVLKNLISTYMEELKKIDEKYPYNNTEEDEHKEISKITYYYLFVIFKTLKIYSINENNAKVLNVNIDTECFTDEFINILGLFILNILLHVSFTDKSFAKNYLQQIFKIIHKNYDGNRKLINGIMINFMGNNFYNGFKSDDILIKLSSYTEYYNIAYEGKYDGKSMYLLKFMAKFMNSPQYLSMRKTNFDTLITISFKKIFEPFSFGQTKNYNHESGTFLSRGKPNWKKLRDEYIVMLKEIKRLGIKQDAWANRWYH